MKRSLVSTQKAQARAKDTQGKLDTLVAIMSAASRLVGVRLVHERLTRDNAQPRNFMALAVAMHMPSTCQFNVGVKRRRLVATAAKFVKHRQAKGLGILLGGAKSVLEQRPSEVRVG